MKILSLVLPCYNESENINKLLDVVAKLQETHSNIEIIIVEVEIISQIHQQL